MLNFDDVNYDLCVKLLLSNDKHCQFDDVSLNESNLINKKTNDDMIYFTNKDVEHLTIINSSLSKCVLLNTKTKQ